MKLLSRHEAFVSASLFGLSMLGAGLLSRYRTYITQQTLLKSPFDTPIPSVPHLHLHANQLRDRVLVIGDIHGCLDEFKSLLEKCKYHPDTSSVVLVGDLVNKGPYSTQVVKYARSIDAFSVRGNHDDVMLSFALKAKAGDKIGIPDRYQYVFDFNEGDIDWLVNLPYTVTLPDPFNCIIVHAGLLPGKSLKEQTAKDMCYLRNVERIEDTGELVGHDQPTKGTPWIEEWNAQAHLSTYSNSPRIYFGHDAKRGLQESKNAVGLDTGCCYGKKLTAMILPDQELVQVDALEVYEEPGLRAVKGK